MRAPTWLLAGLLLAGALAVAWPSTRRRPAVPATGGGTPPQAGLDRTAVDRVSVARAAVARASAWCVGRPRRAVFVAGGVVAVTGWVTAGPVAAAVIGAYATLATRALFHRRVQRRRATAHSRALDDLCALAADLRAGLPPPTQIPGAPIPVGAGVRAGAGASDGPAVVRLGELTAAVWRLAEQTGAPTADLVERLEADARSGHRARVSAAAQAAGAKATALMLTGLPVGGIALGYGIGVDPLRVLLHSPLGAGCAVGAVALQVAGLAWTDRLVNGPPR